MKTKVLMGAAIAVFAIVLALVAVREPAPPNEPGHAPAVLEQGSQSAATPPASPASPASPALDPERLLYDRAYETDPAVVALAKQAGVTPACFVELARYQIHHRPMTPGVCPEVEIGGDRPSLAVGENHPYADYTDAELQSLSVSDARAAVVLARRTESDAEARLLYERAVALSGIAEPLIEFMYERDGGGLFYVDGELDVAAARRGYETLLTAAAIDGLPDPILATYERELAAEGVDLSAIQRRAAAQVAEIEASRQALTGGERP